VGLLRRDERPSPPPRCFSRLEAAELEAEADGEDPVEAVELEERRRPLAPPEEPLSVWPPLGQSSSLKFKNIEIYHQRVMFSCNIVQTKMNYQKDFSLLRCTKLQVALLFVPVRKRRDYCDGAQYRMCLVCMSVQQVYRSNVFKSQYHRSTETSPTLIEIGFQQSMDSLQEIKAVSEPTNR
jgi:hypothetical protein